VEEEEYSMPPSSVPDITMSCMVMIPVNSFFMQLESYVSVWCVYHLYIKKDGSNVLVDFI